MSEKEILSNSAIHFQEWRDEQEFPYERLDSEVVDYFNELIDYSVLDKLIDDNDEIEWEDEFSQKSGIKKDSDTFDIIRTHVTSYISAQRNNNE